MAFKRKSSPTASDQGTKALTKNGALIRQTKLWDTGDDRSEPKCWHVKYLYGLTHIDGTTPNFRNKNNLEFGSSIDINNGYIAVGAPGDSFASVSNTVQEGAVYTYDYQGEYIRRYKLELPATNSRLGERVAITNAGDLLTNDWSSTRRGGLLKTHMWNLHDTFVHEQLDLGTYTDVWDSTANNSFRTIAPPNKFTNYNSQQYTYGGANLPYLYSMVTSAPVESNVQQNFSIFENPKGNISNYTSPTINMGFSIAAGCNRYIVSGWSGNNYNWFASLFDDRGVYLRNIDCPELDERMGYWKQSIAIGCGRIVMSTGNGGSERVFVFDLNGNFLFEISQNTSVYQFSQYWGQSVAVGCGRIVISGEPVSEQARTGTAERIYIYDLNGNFINSVGRHEAHGDNFQANGFEMNTSTTNSGFGESIDIGSGMIVVGAPYYDYSTYNSLGACFVLDLDGNPLVGWTLYGLALANGSNNQQAAISLGENSQRQTYAGSNSLITPGHIDYAYYGKSVAVNDGIIAVGAPGWERGVGYPDAHGLVTVSHFDQLGLDQNIEQSIRTNRSNYIMREADNVEHLEVKDTF